MSTRPNLDDLDRLAGSATAGPWFADEDGGVSTGPIAYTMTSSPIVDTEGCGMGNPADAEFIAAARTAVPALTAALRAVLAAHRPQIIDTVPGDCAVEECEHDDPAECPRSRFAQCVECDRIARESYAYYSETGVETTGWPCATVRAIAVHVEVDQSGAIPSPTGPDEVTK